MVTLEYRVELTLTLQEAQELRVLLERSDELCDKLVELAVGLSTVAPLSFGRC